MIRIVNDWYDSRSEKDIDEIPLNASMIPDVRMIDEFNKPIHAEIIRQVTHGSLYYYGYDVETHYDNDIREVDTELPLKHIKQNKKYQDKKSKYFGLGIKKYKLFQLMLQLGVENPLEILK